MNCLFLTSSSEDVHVSLYLSYFRVDMMEKKTILAQALMIWHYH